MDAVKLHTVFITYNRLELTKRAIESYLDTVTVPWTACIVDNGSTDGTEEWFFERFNEEPLGFTGLGENKYPGYATNLGWSFGFVWEGGDINPDPTHLHRADNDFIFLPGWCDEVAERFSENPRLGQLGLRTDEEELHNTHNVGGNCVIPREIWDAGLRWDERPWPEIKTVGYTEDSFMSPAVVRMGWEWGRVKRPCIQPISVEDPDDPYYIQTWADRGIAR